MDTANIVVLVIAALMVGFAKGGMTLLALLTAPLVSLVMPVSDAIVAVLPLLMVGDAIAVAAYWGEWDNRLILQMLPTALLGIVVGTFLLAELPDDILRRVLGVLVLVYVVYDLVKARLEQLAYEPRTWHGWLVGIGTGALSALANAGGAVFTAYLLLRRTSPKTFIATAALFFGVVNAAKIPFFLEADLIHLDTVLQVMWAAPLIPVGVWVGKRFIEWVNPQTFRWAVLGTLVLAGIFLLRS